MHKKVIERTYGQLARLGPDTKVRRLIPSHEISDVNPFIFLDHLGPVAHRPGSQNEGTGAHPHKGFCTLTYLLSGEVEHKDSRKHHGIVGPGGIQWMMAASGIVHDEKPTRDYLDRGGVLHGFQIWINLPARFKREEPRYMPIQSRDIHEVKVNLSVVRVLVGSFGEVTSPIPIYSPMFTYHIRLSPGGQVSIPVEKSFNVFAYVPAGQAISAGEKLFDTELALFGREGTTVHLQSDSSEDLDILLFGGEPIPEPIVAKGPFVMNSEAEIDLAYEEYTAGKYGTINY